MGYCSRFELEVEATQEDREVFEKLLEDRYLEAEGWYEPYFAYYHEEYGDRMKWYSYQNDMKEISSLFPDILFNVHREGEETGDVEKSYYKNGKAQICPAKLTFENYDESKLQ